MPSPQWIIEGQTRLASPQPKFFRQSGSLFAPAVFGHPTLAVAHKPEPRRLVRQSLPQLVVEDDGRNRSPGGGHAEGDGGGCAEVAPSIRRIFSRQPPPSPSRP